MEEQRQRQEEESKQTVETSKEDKPEAVAAADSGNADEDAMLRNALSMSLAGVRTRIFFQKTPSLSRTVYLAV